MHFTKPFIAALMSVTAIAAPASDIDTSIDKRAVSMMAAAQPQWTIESLKRVCNKANTSCKWSFSIDAHTGAAVPCSFTVTGSPASQKGSRSNGKKMRRRRLHDQHRLV